MIVSPPAWSVDIRPIAATSRVTFNALVSLFSVAALWVSQQLRTTLIYIYPIRLVFRWREYPFAFWCLSFDFYGRLLFSFLFNWNDVHNAVRFSFALFLLSRNPVLYFSIGSVKRGKEEACSNNNHTSFSFLFFSFHVTKYSMILSRCRASCG